MKVKARDIVPGWPKSRSTMPLTGYLGSSLRNLWIWRGWLADVNWEIGKRRILGWVLADWRKFKAEMEATVAYHANQQEMVDGARANRYGHWLGTYAVMSNGVIGEKLSAAARSMEYLVRLEDAMLWMSDEELEAWKRENPEPEGFEERTRG